MKMIQLMGAILVGMLALSVHAEVAVIVNPANSASMSQDDVSRIFLGKSKTFPDGSSATPVDQAGGPAKSAFLSGVVKKNEQQYKAYWSQLLFTGKGQPPQEMGSDADVKSFVAGNADAIGYIDAGAADGSVKVLFTVP